MKSEPIELDTKQSQGNDKRGSFREKFIRGDLLINQRRTRVFGHTQAIEYQMDILSEFSHFLGDTTHALGFNDSDGKATKPGYIFRAKSGAYTVSVFIEIPVKDVMAGIFDGPVATVDGKELLCVSLFRGSTGDGVCDVVGDFSGFLFNRFPINHVALLHIGEAEVGADFGGGPNFSSLNPTMIRGIIRNEIRFLAILEIQFDIFKECGLIAFDYEMIMGFTLTA